MSSHINTILEASLDWIAQAKPHYLCTILKTWGSSPRPAGTMMIMDQSGYKIGSLSGGCIEEDLVSILVNEGLEAPKVFEYGGSQEQESRFQLPCGGSLHILVEPINYVYQEHISSLLSKTSASEIISRSIELIPPCEIQLDTSQDTRMETTHDQGALKAVIPLIPGKSLFLTGMNDISYEVAFLAKRMGWKVFIATTNPDDNASRFESVTHKIYQGQPEEVLEQLSINQHWAVLALAHDPRVDDITLIQALKTPACYIGALGSSRSSAKRIQRLATLGLESSSLGRINAPIGIDIHSKLPQEIAISVIADLIRVFNEKP